MTFAGMFWRFHHREQEDSGKTRSNGRVEV